MTFDNKRNYILCQVVVSYHPSV